MSPSAVDAFRRLLECGDEVGASRLLTAYSEYLDEADPNNEGLSMARLQVQRCSEQLARYEVHP